MMNFEYNPRELTFGQTMCLGTLGGALGYIMPTRHPVAAACTMATNFVAKLVISHYIVKKEEREPRWNIADIKFYVSISEQITSSISLVALQCLGLPAGFVIIRAALIARQALVAVIDYSSLTEIKKNVYKIATDATLGASTITALVALGIIGPLGVAVTSTALAAFLIYELPENSLRSLA